MHAVPLNPYIAGGEISHPGGRGFYGREDIFSFVRAVLLAEQRTPMLLYGQRRIGKSSVLRQLPNHLPSEFVCVYYDLQGKASMDLDQVLYGLARAIADQVQIPRPSRDEATEQTFVEAFLVRAIQALDGHPDRLILLFDEFDILDERIAGEHVAARRFIGFLGSLVSGEPHIGYIMVVGRKTDELSEEVNSTLLKNSVQERIGRLEEAQVLHLIQELAQGYLQFTDDALTRIYTLTAGHPYCTQLLCHTIWSLWVKEGGAFPIAVTGPQVDEALSPALQRGTLGLNWIFDGLTAPAHRLFLSALAEVSDPVREEAASFSMIEKALANRQVSVDTIAMQRAPRELERWDIVTSGHAGFRFVVPMSGAWIRRERSLDQLEKEARYVNPRAYRYYELAVEAEHRGDFDQAITDYTGALQANPVFLEAQQALAAALRQRQKPGDMDAAIEAYERALELDAETSTSGLLQALLQSLESEETESVKVAARLKRLHALAPEGPIHARAERVLRERATRMSKDERYREAATIFEAIGEEALAQASTRQGRLASLSQVTTATLGISAVFLQLFFGGSLDSLKKMLLWAFISSTLGGAFSVSRFRRGFLGNTKPFILRRSTSASFVRLCFGTILSFAVGLIPLLILGWGGIPSEIIAFLTGVYALYVLLSIKYPSRLNPPKSRMPVASKSQGVE